MQTDSTFWTGKVPPVLQVIAGTAAAIWAAFPVVYQTLLILMAFDLVTAWVRSVARNEFSAKILKTGLLMKVSILLAVGVAHVLERRMGIPIATGVAAAFTLAEAASTWRNLSLAGVRLPASVTKLLRSLQRSNSEDLDSTAERAKKKKALGNDRDQP
jgi:toxin secretion/phage lysis holin